MIAIRPQQFRRIVKRERAVPICPYCEEPAILMPGRAVYPNRPDLWTKPIWRCRPCGAWVGCHPGTEKPLGRLANAELRAAKSAAHAAFDPLWKAKMRREQCSQSKARKAGYKWLADQMGMNPKRCHIGMMDVAECQRVVEICQRRGR